MVELPYDLTRNSHHQDTMARSEFRKLSDSVSLWLSGWLPAADESVRAPAQLLHSPCSHRELRISQSIQFIYPATHGANVLLGGGAIVTGGAEGVAQLIV
jgi:hypothetical protein